MLNINIIRTEFINNEKSSKYSYFHDIDPNFMKDTRYTCIELFKHKKWKNNTDFKNTIKELKTVFGENIGQAFFSIMKGSKFIAPHKDNDSKVNYRRYHYSIIVHKNDNAYLKVKNKKHYWKENDFFYFDPKEMHSVFKPKTYKRVLLIVDVLF